MGVPSTASTDRPDAGRRTIRSALTATVVVPAVCLLLVWVAVAAVVLGSAMAGRGYFAQHRNVADIAVAGLGVIVLLVVVVLAGSFARRLSRDAMSLAATARSLASQQPGRPAPASQDTAVLRPRRQTAEMAQSEAAITSLHRTATAATASEAGLRKGLREVFVSMARRNQSLLQRQLRLIDALEQKASDPAALADLFSLDHLTTRMRRHAESLAILSGAAPGRAWREPVPVIDVIRGAMAEVEDYKRVSVLTRSEDSVTGPAVADMIHLIAELIENATLFSPSGTRVEVRAGRVANGFAVEIDDRGLGVEPDQLAEINKQLASPPDFDLANSDRLGLFVGGKLAARHGVKVLLRTSPYGGTTAIVLMPNGIVVPAPGSLPEAGLPEANAPEGSRLGALQADARRPDAGQPESADAARRPGGLNARGTEALALVGRHSAPAADQPESAADSTPEGRLPGARIPRPDLPSRRSLHRRASAGGPGPLRPSTASADPAGPASASAGLAGPGSASADPADVSGAQPPAAPIADDPGLSLPTSTAPTSTAPTSTAPTGAGPTADGPTGAGPTADADRTTGTSPADADRTTGMSPAGTPPAGMSAAGTSPAGTSPAGMSPAGTPPAAVARPGNTARGNTARGNMPRSDAAPADQGVSLFTPRSSRRAAGAGGLPSGTPTPAPAQTDIGRSSGSVVGGSLFEKRAAGSSATGGATSGTAGTGGNGAAEADPAAGGAAAGGTYHGLPRRTKQASLSPHLRGTSPASRSADSSASPVDPPAPEHARNLAASLQSGWLRGREEDPKEDPEVPQSEDGQ